MAAKQKFVGKAKTRRTNRRIARLRVDNPKALPKIKADNRYTPREVRRVKRVANRVATRQNAKKQKAAAKAQPYNPLAMLTGKQETQEENAAARIQYGPQKREINQQLRGNEQTAINTANYYDDYKKALADATARVSAANQAAVNDTQSRTDQAYAQDSARVAQENAAASQQAAKLGRAPVQDTQATQAIAAERSQQNQHAAAQRAQGVADTGYMELRGAGALQGKAEAEAKLSGARNTLLKQRQNLKSDISAFKLKTRADNRQSEREYAAVKKEFGLKKKDLALKYKDTRADRQLERQKLKSAQIVAKMYASANKAGAKAQVRVAKLQLKKGRISKHQYRQIVNVYKGLPQKPKHTTQDITYHGLNKGKGGGGKQGQGSGKNGALAPWEKDRINEARHEFDTHNLGSGDRQKAINVAVKNGVPARLARIAWRQYMRAHGGAPTARGNASHPGRVGGPMGTGRLN